MTRPKGEIGTIIEELAAEQLQEKEVEDDRGSILAEAPDDETLRARAREYDDDVKHWVRKSLWLRFARQLCARKKRKLRLLTLPGRHALEVKLYEKEGVLDTISDETGERLAVVGFEYEPTEYGQLATTGPRMHRLINGSIVDALIRPELPVHAALAEEFPFDIINLDLTTNLVAPREAPYGEVLRAIEECIERQRALNEDWVLMVTFRAVSGHTNPETEEQLQKIFVENIESYPELRAVFVSEHGEVDPATLYGTDYGGALGEFFGKWLADSAVRRGWEVARFAHVFYRRAARGGYEIRKVVAHLRRAPLDEKRIPHSGAKLSETELAAVARAIQCGLGRDYDAHFEEFCRRKPDLKKAIRDEVTALVGAVEDPVDGPAS